MGTTEEELQKQTPVVRTFRDDINMEIGLDKCEKAVLKRGKLVHSQNIILDLNTEIQALYFCCVGISFLEKKGEEQPDALNSLLEDGTHGCV
jgi:hypothetical protein